MSNLAEVALVRGDSATAEGPLHEALAISTPEVIVGLNADIYKSLGRLVHEAGDGMLAREHLRSGLRSAMNANNAWHASQLLTSMAVVAAERGYLSQAARLGGATTRLLEEIDATIEPRYRSTFEHALETARATLGPSSWDAAWSAGAAMTLAEAAADALNEAEEPDQNV